jgi:hypothetical protein
MDWKELLAKFRLVDITPKVEGGQVGGVNVNVEDNSDKRIYNFNFYDVKGVDRIVAGDVKIDAVFEKKVMEETERRLINLGISPDLLSETTRTEIGTSTTAASAVDVFKSEDAGVGREKAILMHSVIRSSEPKPHK